MKKILCLTIAILLMLSIMVGCGSKTAKDVADESTNENVQENVNDSKDEDEKEEDVLPDEGTGEPVTLTYLSWHNETTLKPILDAFHEKHPNITIDLQFAPPIHDYIEKAKVLFLAGESPDIFVTAAENKLEVIENGYAIDISHLPVFARMSDTFKNTYAKDGKIYAFAPDAWIGGLFYNKKIFQEVGVSPPNSYSEFLELLKTLKDAGIKPIAFHNDNLYDIPQALFITETINYNPDYDQEVNEGERTYVEGWTEPFKMWKRDFIDQGYVTKDMLGISAEEVVDEFVTEKVAMIVGGPWNIAGFEEKNPDLDFDLMPFVGTEAGVKWNIGAVGVGFSVGSQSKHQEEALKYLEFLSSDEGLKLFQEATGGILGVDGIEYSLHPVLEQYKSHVIEGKFYLPAVAWKHSDAMGREMSIGSQDILAGVAEPEEIPERMDQKRIELDQAN